MKLGTKQEGHQKVIETETYAFSREQFPLHLQSHRIRILKNKMYERRDGKLRIRIHLQCGKCKRSSHSISETVTMINKYKRNMILWYSLSDFVTHDCN